MTPAPIALLTPMANPTVEREMRRLLLPDVDYLVGRLVGTEADSTTRLRQYAENLGDALLQFGGFTLSAVAFACTASSYLIGSEHEKAIARQVGLPVLWAAGCIREELIKHSARRIAVISPYPDPIHQAGLGYWRKAGFEVAFDRRIDIGSQDTRAIYDLDGSEALDLVAQARKAGPDLILLSGTGMPTLSLLDPGGTPPVISSNHCLAQAMIAFQDRNS